MGIPSEQGSFSAGSVLDFGSVQSTLSSLAAGEVVDAGAVEDAHRAVVDGLWSDRSDVSATAESLLPMLFDSVADDLDRQAQLIGDLLAAGERAGVAFDSAVQETGILGGHLTPDEIEQLEESLGKAPVERLALLAKWLQQDMPADGSSGSQIDDLSESGSGSVPEQVPDSESPVDPPPIYGPVSRGPEITSEPNANSAAAGTSPGDLGDTSLPESDRVARAVASGGEAIPQLATELSGDMSELAAAALIDLGRSEDLRLEVFDAALMLEADPESRSGAEFVRRALDGSEQSPTQLNAMAVGLTEGSWLLRAIEGCDSQNILCAATGREILAIPLVMARLVNRRAEKDLQA